MISLSCECWRHRSVNRPNENDTISKDRIDLMLSLIVFIIKTLIQFLSSLFYEPRFPKSCPDCISRTNMVSRLYATRSFVPIPDNELLVPCALLRLLYGVRTYSSSKQFNPRYPMPANFRIMCEKVYAYCVGYEAVFHPAIYANIWDFKGGNIPGGTKWSPSPGFIWMLK